jgi:hypothetical protein
MKFSTSLCLPANVIGFSYFILLAATVDGKGYYYGYYYVLGPASATGTYDYEDNVGYYITCNYKSFYEGFVLSTPNCESIPLLLVCETCYKYSYNNDYASAAIY